MPYLDTAQDWLTQSTRLLQACPSTTRITTKYRLSAPSDPSKPAKKVKKDTVVSTSKFTEAPDFSAPSEESIRASLVLKTFDPVSGVTLKYKTKKGQEVGRLIQILGKLAKPMAGLGTDKEDGEFGPRAGSDVEVTSKRLEEVGDKLDGSSVPGLAGVGDVIQGQSGGRSKKSKRRGKR